MVCIQDFNPICYFKEGTTIEPEPVPDGCFSVIPLSFAGSYLYHGDVDVFFRMMRQTEQRMTSVPGPGLKGFNTILSQYGLEWEGDEYDPLTFLRTFHRHTFVLCGFYLKNTNVGHAIAFFADWHPASDFTYIFDPNHGLFRGDRGYPFEDQLEYYLLSKYPDIDPGRVSFRNVRRAFS